MARLQINRNKPHINNITNSCNYYSSNNNNLTNNNNNNNKTLFPCTVQLASQLAAQNAQSVVQYQNISCTLELLLQHKHCNAQCFQNTSKSSATYKRYTILIGDNLTHVTPTVILLMVEILSVQLTTT